jgi:predicted chitinase
MKKSNINEIITKELNKLYVIKEDTFLQKILSTIKSKLSDDVETNDDDNSFFGELGDKIKKTIKNFIGDEDKPNDEEENDVDLSKVNVVGEIDLSGGGFDSKQKQIIKYLIESMEDKGITNPYTQIGILSVISKETGFKLVPEYGYSHTSNNRIREIFGRRANRYSDDELNQLKKSDYDFFEAMYGMNSGIKLGNDEPGDGYKYLGRGLNGLTGKGNYRKYGQKIGVDLVGNPDLLNNPKIATKVALTFLTKGKSGSSLPEFTDKEDAASYFADINAGGYSDSHRGKAIAASNRFDVNFNVT